MTVDGVTYTYTYDELNQLTEVETSDNSFTASYSYDNGGNITSKTVNGVTTAYGYTDTNWKDKLTSYNGHAISYDPMGNPVMGYNKLFSWTGRQLTAAEAPDGSQVDYTYNADGIRTQKMVHGVVTDYFVDGSTILAEKTGSNIIWYIYDTGGELLGFTCNGIPYYYLKNQQGDVYKIVDANGSVVGSYTYDPWGKVIRTVGYIAEINPIRYRSYYYDSETQMYYLQSRYYDPELGRWISPEPNVCVGGFDAGAGFVGYNVYAYCANNPVSFFDPTGEFVVSTLLICVAAGAIIGATIGGFIGNAYANSKGYTGWDKTKCILTGVGIGGVAGGALGYCAAPAVVSATGVAGISVTTGGVTTIAAIGTSFGKLGTLIANNGQQIIDWTKTTVHGLQRMAERGVTQSMVEAWVKTGQALQQAGDKIIYITKDGAAVVNKAGQVITAYTSAYYDAAMQEVIVKIFGK